MEFFDFFGCTILPPLTVDFVLLLYVCTYQISTSQKTPVFFPVAELFLHILILFWLFFIFKILTYRSKSAVNAFFRGIVQAKTSVLKNSFLPFLRSFKICIVSFFGQLSLGTRFLAYLVSICLSMWEQTESRWAEIRRKLREQKPQYRNAFTASSARIYSCHETIKPTDFNFRAPRSIYRHAMPLKWQT